MKTWHILLIVGGGILLLLILAIVCIRMANKKRYLRLRDNLQKFQREKEELSREGDNALHNGNIKVELSPPVDPMNNHSFGQPVVEDYAPEEEVKELPLSEPLPKPQPMPKEIETEPLLDKTEMEQEGRKKREIEFERFMDEHAFSRKVLDKKMIERLKKLSPEMQQVLLNNIFNKFDD